MGKASERRLRAMMRKADARKKGSLLANNLVETAFSGTPLLTKREEDDMLRSFKSDDERQEYDAMFRAAYSLAFCVTEAEIRLDEVVKELFFLGGYFGKAREYQHFRKFLDELCLNRSGQFNKRLQERAVSIGRLAPYFYNITLEEDGDRKFISLEMSDEDLTFIAEITESVEQKASELKAVTKAIRDVMKQYAVPIKSYADSIDRLEKSARKVIRLTKCLLYNTDYEGWDELRLSLSQRADPLLTMMEALADYDDIAFDEALYDETIRSLNREIAGTRG